MCMDNFSHFEKVPKTDPKIGYRNWILEDNKELLRSQYVDYYWQPKIGRHTVKDKNSGLYSYNYYYYNNNNNYNYYNNNNNNYNYYYYYNNYNYYYYYNNNNYYIAGIIHQYGKIAIHRDGYRSEYAKIDTLFTIRKSDAQGSVKFLNWIDKFNERIEKIAKIYNVKTEYWQDFIERMK